MAPFWLQNLLSQQNPGGLLGAMAQPDPIKAALAQMAANPQQARMAPPGQQQLRIPQAPPAVQRQAPVAPTIGRRPPLTASPMSPNAQGALAGLQATFANSPGSAYTGPGPQFAAALGASLNASAGARERQAQVKAAQEEVKAYQASVLSPAIPEEFRSVLGAMPPAEGRKIIAEIVKQSGETKVVGKDARLATASGKVLLGAAPEKDEFREAGGRLFRITPDGKLTQVADAPENDNAVKYAMGRVFGNKDASWAMAHDKGVVDLVSRYVEEYRRSGATNVTQQMPEKGILEQIGPGLQKEKEAAQGTLRAMNSLMEADSLLREGIVAGSFAPKMVDIGNAFVRLGIIPADSDKAQRLDRSKQYLAATARSILDFVQATGGGLRGLTEEERKWMTQAQAGNIADRPEALQGVLNALIKASRESVSGYNTRVDGILQGMDPVAHQYYRLADPPTQGGAAAAPALDFTQRPGETVEQWAARIASGK